MVPSEVVKQEAGVELESGEAIDDGKAIDAIDVDMGDFLRSFIYPLLQITDITQILLIRSVTTASHTRCRGGEMD